MSEMIFTHPFDKQTYRLMPDGLVLVTDEVTHKEGYFTRDGEHVRGDLQLADPLMLNWVGGAQT